MPRDERIEAILAAWYELEECAPHEKAGWRDRRNALLDEAIAGTGSCRQEVVQALGSRFQAYQLARRKEHREKMAQILRKP